MADRRKEGEESDTLGLASSLVVCELPHIDCTSIGLSLAGSFAALLLNDLFQ